MTENEKQLSNGVDKNCVGSISLALEQAVKYTPIPESWNSDALTYLQVNINAILHAIGYLYQNKWENVRIKEAMDKVNQLIVKERLKTETFPDFEEYSILKQIRQTAVRTYQVNKSETTLVSKMLDNALSLLTTGKLKNEQLKIKDKDRMAFIKLRPTSGRRLSPGARKRRTRYS